MRQDSLPKWQKKKKSARRFLTGKERERGLQSTELSPTSLIQKKRPFTGPGWNWENVL